jgi:membrane-associated phospholipid phosphatase
VVYPAHDADMLNALKQWSKSFLSQVGDALSHCRAWWERWWILALPMLVVAGASLWWLTPLDAEVKAWVQQTRAESTALNEVAKSASYYGDFLGLNLTLFVFGHGLARAWRSRRLHRLATAGLLCACMSGLSANLLRFATGRPRPAAEMQDGFYGPHRRSNMQSFPSAHTATAMGAALPVLINCPPLGVPLAAAASVVAWSRIQLNRHHLTDVLGSTLLALLFAIPLARWAANAGVASRAASPETLPAHALRSA